MRFRKVLISVFCIAIAMAISTPALAGSGAIEMTFDKTVQTPDVTKDPPNWTKCAELRLRKVHHRDRGWAIVTACGTAEFNDATEQLLITLSDAPDKVGPQTWIVTPGQGLKQSFCVEMAFRVQKAYTEKFYLLAQFDAGVESVETNYMSAQVFKHNKVDANLP